MNRLKLEGQKFGRLTVIEYAGNSKWLCQCDCGNKHIVKTALLTRGVTKSCGCYKRELTSQRTILHGESKTRLYSVWCGIKGRCYNENTPKYKNYGGRGIVMCDEWNNDYQNFKNWAINNGYQENLSIDRIDVDGNYEPSNCRWVTQKEQQNNRSNNRLLTLGDATHTLMQWSDITGLKRETISHRINKYGWTIEKALTTPVRQKGDK